MRKAFYKFVYALAIFTAILGIIAVFLQYTLPENMLPASLPLLFLLFIIVSSVVHYFLLRSAAYSGRRFVSYFMAATFLKLFLYLIIIILYAFLIKENVVSFILTFFILYLLYTTFEVVMILKQNSR